MKKVLSLLLIGVFSLALAGCVTIDDEPYEVDCDKFPTHPDCVEGVDPDDPTGPGLVNVLAELPTEQIDITFWHVYGAGKNELLNELITEFEALYPNINVTDTSQGNYTDVRSNTISAIQAGTTPTLVVGYPDHVAGYLKGNAIIPLDDFIKHETWGVDLDDFFDSYIDENSQYPGGYMYSFPYSKSTEMMVYNKDIFAANGITVPTDGSITWEMLDTWADTLVDPNWDPENPTADKCEYLINFDSSGNFFINNVRMWQGGYTNAAGDILINDDNTKDMLEYVQARFNDNTFSIPLAWGESYGSANFIAQDVCMSVGSTAGINYNIPADASFEVGVVPIPQYDMNNKSAVQQGPNIAIMSNSTDAERLAAWLLIKFLTDTENTAAWAMDTGYLPVRKSGFDTQDYQDFLALTDKTDSDYYYSLASQAAYMQTEYLAFDPAFAGAYTSSDARDQAGIAMEALFGNNSVQDIINDMLAQLGQ
jgi:multiple sugar transport system substrate-binding protein